jgi:hypothetical protein
VLYKLGANSGGLTLFVEDGILCYEYNLFLIMRTKIRATQKSTSVRPIDLVRPVIRSAVAAAFGIKGRPRSSGTAGQRALQRQS